MRKEKMKVSVDKPKGKKENESGSGIDERVHEATEAVEIEQRFRQVLGRIRRVMVKDSR